MKNNIRYLKKKYNKFIWKTLLLKKYYLIK